MKCISSLFKSNNREVKCGTGEIALIIRPPDLRKGTLQIFKKIVVVVVVVGVGVVVLEEVVLVVVVVVVVVVVAVVVVAVTIEVGVEVVLL
ncbi:hypothetical protein DPMN_089560 [Dreissena polymorpha]|uniref:Uncharacterized protein n=1 Tax=Dreissena polymorpha TaxID=45954 RepID=A0A9D4KYK0_DREPO|nr:hypothetical protein DPMN_089560 [Dreissena polymorpha]